MENVNLLLSRQFHETEAIRATWELRCGWGSAEHRWVTVCRMSSAGFCTWATVLPWQQLLGSMLSGTDHGRVTVKKRRGTETRWRWTCHGSLIPFPVEKRPPFSAPRMSHVCLSHNIVKKYSMYTDKYWYNVDLNKLKFE